VIEKVEKVAQKLTILKNRLEGLFDFDSSFVSGNATFEHLPREIAQQKLRLTGEIAKGVSE
jgi:methionine synthase II (cobalamin-independent)